MALYEHVFLARQDLAQAQVDTLAEAATKIIEDMQGKVVKTETWGLRNLAYRIAKNRKAHYVQLDIDAPAGAVAELERGPARDGGAAGESREQAQALNRGAEQRARDLRLQRDHRRVIDVAPVEKATAHHVVELVAEDAVAGGEPNLGADHLQGDFRRGEREREAECLAQRGLHWVRSAKTHE